MRFGGMAHGRHAAGGSRCHVTRPKCRERQPASQQRMCAMVFAEEMQAVSAYVLRHSRRQQRISIAGGPARAVRHGDAGEATNPRRRPSRVR